jgi:hypothetical protein
MFGWLRKPLLTLLLIQFSSIATLGEWLHHHWHSCSLSTASRGHGPCCHAHDHCDDSHASRAQRQPTGEAILPVEAGDTHDDCAVCSFLASPWSACLTADQDLRPKLLAHQLRCGKPVAQLRFPYAPHDPRGPPFFG